MRRLSSLAAVAAVLAGCGNARQTAPDVATPRAATGTVPFSAPEAGIRLSAPAGWVLTKAPAEQAPLVVTMTSGRATIAIYRYPRAEPLPRTSAKIDEAATALSNAAKTRDATFTELKRPKLKIDGHRVVQLRGTETIAGLPRTVRSTHIYAAKGEVVVEAFAPDADFLRVDAEVFDPVLKSVRLSRPTGA